MSLIDAPFSAAASDVARSRRQWGGGDAQRGAGDLGVDDGVPVGDLRMASASSSAGRSLTRKPRAPAAIARCT